VPPANATATPAPALAAPQRVTVVAALISFATVELRVQVGQSVTLTFKNDAVVTEGAILHNWHLLGVKDTTGAEPATPLIPGGEEAVIMFTLTAPGTYKFICDAHPNEMVGSLRVQ
jgi:plastocyanin